MTCRTYGLTGRTAELLAYLRLYIGQHGYAPSYEEIRQHFDLASKSGVHRLMAQLVERGAGRWLPGKARSFALSDGQTYRLPPVLSARLAAEAHRRGRDPHDYLAEIVAWGLGEDEAERAPRCGAVQPAEVRA